MPQDGHCSLAIASFEVIAPPKKSQFFRGQKNENSPLKTGCARRLLKKKTQTHFFSSPSFSAVFVKKILSRRCRLPRTTKDPAKNSGKFQPKIAYPIFPVKKIGTILSRRSRLPRTSRAPSRLIRPRPIDCDRGPKQRVKIFPVFGFELCQKKVFSKGPRSNPDLHPKSSPQPDFCDRGVSNRVTNAGQKKTILGAASLYKPPQAPHPPTVHAFSPSWHIRISVSAARPDTADTIYASVRLPYQDQRAPKRPGGPYGPCGAAQAAARGGASTAYALIGVV